MKEDNAAYEKMKLFHIDWKITNGYNVGKNGM